MATATMNRRRRRCRSPPSLATALSTQKLAAAPFFVAALVVFVAAANAAGGGGSSSSQTQPPPISPVKHLSASLAASSASGTAVAVRWTPSSFGVGETQGRGLGECSDDDECVVILARSPVVAPSAGASSSTQAATLRPSNNLTVASVADAVHANGDDNAADDGLNQSDASLRHRGGATAARDETDRNDELLIFLPRGPARIPHGHSSRGGAYTPSKLLYILQEQLGLALALTGFAPDASHLVRCAAGSVALREAVYGTGAGSPSRLTVHRILTEDVSKRMSDVARAEGGRPFGVQILAVGPGSGGGGGRRGGALRMYTVDPSGNWRHWGGGGAAVGRGAAAVRAGLGKALEQRRRRRSGSPRENAEDEPSLEEGQTALKSSWRDALDVAMEAIVGATEELDPDGDYLSPNDDNVAGASAAGRYDAIVIFGRSASASRGRGASRCAAVHPDAVNDSYRQCVSRLRQRSSSAVLKRGVE